MRKILSALFLLASLVALTIALASCGSSKSCVDGGTEHQWGSYQKIAATCSEDGKKIRECKLCGETDEDDTYNAPTATGDHTYVDNVCTVCGMSKYDCDEGRHNWGKYTIVKATCGTDGSKYHICKDCDEIEYIESYAEKYPATGNHTYDSEGNCTVCGSVCSHNWQINESISYAATCKKAGYAYYQCSLCSMGKAENLDMLEHTFEETRTVSPTCATEGYTLYTCSACGTTDQKDKVEATGLHNWNSNWITTVEPTQYRQGSKYQSCTKCSTKNVQTIPSLTDTKTLNIKNFVYTGGKYKNEAFVNVALNGGAEASSYYRTTSAANAIDGDSLTYWQADTLVDGADFIGQTFVVYLAQEYDVGAVVLTIPNYTSWELGEGCYVSYMIEAYIDGEWVEVGEISDADANDDTSENAVAMLYFDTPQKTDRIRATVTHSTRYAPAKIHEFAVYAYTENIERIESSISGTATVTVSGKYNDYAGGAANLADGSSSTYWFTDSRSNATPYAIFSYTSEQFLAYVTWETQANTGRTFKLYVETNGKWQQVLNPDSTDGQFSVPATSDSHYTFVADVGLNVTSFKLEITKEPTYWESYIYEICPYTIVEDEANAPTYDGCKHLSFLSKGTLVKPTCTDAGYTLRACVKCGYEAKTDATDAKGHTWGEYELTSAATKETNGEKTAVCQTCGAKKYQVLPATLYGDLEAPTITTYYHNAPAAWSMTLDDGNYLSTYEWIIPRLQEYGFRATVVMALTFTDSLVSTWQKYFATGVIDLGSHSVSHGNLYSGELLESSMISDVNDGQFKFMAYYHGQRLLGFATPNGGTSSDTAEFVTDIYAAGRNGGAATLFNDPAKLTTRKAWGNLNSYVSKKDQTEGVYTYVSKDQFTFSYIFSEEENRLVSVEEITGTYYYNESTYIYEWHEGGSLKKVGDTYEYVDNDSGDYVLAHTSLGSYEIGINQLLDEGSWSVECIHEIAPYGDIHVDYAPTMSKFEYLKKTGVWVCSYTDAIQYIKETQSSTVNFKSVEAGKITLTLTQTLDNYMFNHELTVKVDIPDYWTEENITVTQNGENVYFFVEDGYCYLDAVPNCGDIVISDYVD